MAVTIALPKTPSTVAVEKKGGELFRDIERAKEAYLAHQRNLEMGDQRRQREFFETVRKNFALRAEHLKLLREMKFELFLGTDVVCVGVRGAYPFGNYEWVEDVHRILGWAMPWKEYDGSPSDEDRFSAGKIMAELPLAVNAIMQRLDDWKGLVSDELADKEPK